MPRKSRRGVIVISKEQQFMQDEQTPRQPEQPYQPQPAATPPSPPPAPTAPPTEYPAAPAAAEPPKAHGVQIVWQLLTYALWSWALTALVVLLTATLSYYLLNSDGDYEFSIYAFAAVICLLPMAFFADKIYARQEPEHKHGFAAVVMVLSAVLVFLASLGGLITAVVTIFTLFVNPGDTGTKQVVILSALIVTALGGMLFVRILNVPRLRRFVRLFPLIALAVTGLATVMAVAGPFRSEIAARNDKLLESHLPKVNQAIQDYARKNSRLPANLQDIDLSGAREKDAKYLVDKNLVEYKVVAATAPDTYETPNNRTTTTRNLSYRPGRQTGNYELCATFNKAKNDKYADSVNGRDDYGSTYISAYYHPAGRHCFKLRAYFGK